MRIVAIDDRPLEIKRLLHEAGLEDNKMSSSYFVFCFNLEDTVREALNKRPDIILLGHGLSHPTLTGSDIAKALRKAGFSGIIAGNSGGGSSAFTNDNAPIDFFVDRDPDKLRRLIESLS